MSKVPQVTIYFWVVKALTTAFGEAMSDYLVHVIAPVLAVAIGFVAFAASLLVQFRVDRYRPLVYWFAVAMVGTFGTMAADVLHVGFGVPYSASSVLFAVVLTCVFVAWRRSQGTVSIHSITTRHRELFYWAAVVSTFAMGTAVGDFAANVAGLGYFAAGLVFAALIVVTVGCYRWLNLGSVLAFWTAYVLTRPLGASFADWLGKPTHVGGLGVGDGLVSGGLAVVIVGFVTYLAVTGVDTPADARGMTPARMR